MSTAKTLLDVLRSKSQVDCDTLDPEVARILGPFVDCTSNQAIAYGELSKPENASLVTEAIDAAKSWIHEYAATGEVTFEQLATEIMMIKLSSRMAAYLTGFVHVQTNPYHAYSTERTVANAKRIMTLFSKLTPTLPRSRICIKIPSTYEGLRACSILEALPSRIHTLATTLFSPLQAATAARANCTYIAPYVNELKVHFVPGYIDADKGFEVCRSAQRGFVARGKQTMVLPASLTSVAEVMQLAGVAHITVSPPLLAELAATDSSVMDPALWGWCESSEEDQLKNTVADYEFYETLVDDEAAWRMAHSRSKNGADEKKLVDAVNIFADMQDRMENIVKAAVR
ncbi:hypothetical protein AAFC00_004025 [Neodothiora populina]|uniref:Transaldolase n=1 Tax=Neodothiora populina TaxID=2781224 RepID=A0ABR3PJD5_9PEZI